MSLESDDRSTDTLVDGLGSIKSGRRQHKKYRPPGLLPRYTTKDGPTKRDGISISELSCMNIDQIVEMLENKYGGLVGSVIFVPGNHYGFIVNTAKVSEMFNDGSLAVDFKTLFYDFYTSAFTSPHCGKQRFLLQEDYMLSCIMKVTDKDLAASIDKNRDSVSDIFKIIDGIEYSIVSRNDDPIIAPENSYKLIPHPIQKYLNNVDTERIPFFLREKPTSLLSEEPDYRKASS